MLIIMKLQFEPETESQSDRREQPKFILHLKI